MKSSYWSFPIFKLLLLVEIAGGRPLATRHNSINSVVYGKNMRSRVENRVEWQRVESFYQKNSNIERGELFSQVMYRGSG